MPNIFLFFNFYRLIQFFHNNHSNSLASGLFFLFRNFIDYFILFSIFIDFSGFTERKDAKLHNTLDGRKKDDKRTAASYFNQLFK